MLHRYQIVITRALKTALNPKTNTARLLLALMLTATVFTLVLLVFIPSYPVIDDIGMMMRVAGLSKVDAPTPIIMNSNTLIGYGLSYLYTLWPNFDWYPFFLLAMLYLSGSTMLFSFIRIRSGTRALILSVVFLYMVIGTFALGLTFTVTAFALGLAGSALTFSLLLHPPKRKSTVVLSTIFAIMLFVLCTLVREKAFFLIALLSVLLVPFIVWGRIDRRGFILGAIIALSSLTISVAAISYDRQVYQSTPQWSAFWVQKKIKSRFVEMRQIVFTDETRPKFAACGVTKNDFSMMRIWFFDTRLDNFKLAKIQCLDRAFPHIKNTINWEASVRNSISIYSRHWLIIGFMAAIALLPPMTRRKALTFLAMIVLPALVFLYLDVRFKPAPPRVSLPVFAFSVFAILLAHLSEPSRKLRIYPSWGRALSLLSVLGLIIIIGLQTRLYQKTSQLTVQSQAKLVDYTHQLAPDPAHLYILWSGSAFPIEWAAPFSHVRQLFSTYNQVGIGGGFNSPLTRKKMRQFNINNPYLDIIDNPDVSIILKSKRVAALYLPLYHDFVRINYGRKTCHELEKTIGDIVVYTIKAMGHCQKKLEESVSDGY